MRAILTVLLMFTLLFSCRTKKVVVEKDNSEITRTEVIDTLVTIDSSVVSVSIPVNVPDTTLTFETVEQIVTVQKEGGQFKVRAVAKERQVPVRKKITSVEIRDAVYKQRDSVPSENITNAPRCIVFYLIVLIIILFILNKLFRA